MSSFMPPSTMSKSIENTMHNLDSIEDCNLDKMDSQDDTTNLILDKSALFSRLIGNDPQQILLTPSANPPDNDNIVKGPKQSLDKVNDDPTVTADYKSGYTANEVKGDVNHSTNNFEQGQLFTRIRNKWYTNDEVASILTNFNSHPEWQTNELQIRPKSETVLLYSREKVRYRQDGYCWKKRKNGRTTREDHMKLKVQGIDRIYGCYVHSAILPTFHRRCYWLLENPDIVLVHYLNQPPDDLNKMILAFNSSILEAETCRTWTNEEIIEEIGAVFGGISQINQTLSITLPTSNCNIMQSTQSNLMSSQQNVELEEATIGSSSQARANTSNKIVVEQSGHDSKLIAPDKDVIKHGDNIDNEIERQKSDNEYNEDSHNQPSAGGTNNMSYSLNSATQNQTTSSAIVADLKNLNDFQMCDRSLGGDDLGVRDHLMDQGSCSPVTQIYNKIVDDIETYALPIEPSEFVNHHRHDHGVQSMDFVESSNDDSSTPTGQSTQMSSNLLQSRQLDEAMQTVCDQDVKLVQDESDCSVVDLVSCDLFGKIEQNDTKSRAVDGSRADDILLTDFNLPESNVSSHVTDDINSGTTNNLDNDDDLGNLMMGISAPDGPDITGATNLIADANSLDLFNFRASNHEQRHYQNQLDVKSTTSDTGALNRLSPLASLVPRCNSTDDALQRLDQHQCYNHQQHHHSSNDYLKGIHNNGNCEHHRSVANSNSTSCSPSHSSSSLMASGGSMGGGNGIDNLGLVTLASGGNEFDKASSLQCSMDSSQNNEVIMKLPLQHRQHSEHKEPSQSVLSFLLPKALSLDGSDLSTNGNHVHHHQQQPDTHTRGMTSPLVGTSYASTYQCQNSHNLLVPNVSEGANSRKRSMYSRTVPNNRGNFYQRPSAPSLSTNTTPNIVGNYSSDTTNRILVSSSSVVGSQSFPKLLPILDYVPNWSVSTGGTKVLIIGNWGNLIMSNRPQHLFSDDMRQVQVHEDAFHAIFDDLLVPAVLIQNNVLRCYSPAHSPGFVALRIVYKSTIVSEQVLFEMRVPVTDRGSHSPSENNVADQAS